METPSGRTKSSKRSGAFIISDDPGHKLNFKFTKSAGSSSLITPLNGHGRQRSASPPPNLEAGGIPPLRTQTPVQVNGVEVLCQIFLGYRSTLKRFLEDPNSSLAASVYAIFSAAMIVGSSLLVIIETLPQYYRSEHLFWFISETIIIVCFTVEFCLRLFAHTTSLRDLRRHLCSFFMLCDLLSILPYYVEVFIYGERVGELQKFTVLRLFRLFRLVRCYSYSRMLQLSVDAMLMSMRKSAEALMAIVLLLGLVAVVSSTALYFAERGTWDAENRRWINVLGLPSHFDSIPATLWFVMEVITTVGLGDVYPVTSWGKILSFPLMIIGLMIIALPSIVVGRHFAESWAHLKTISKLRRRHPHLLHEVTIKTEQQQQQQPSQQSMPCAPSEQLWQEMRMQNALLQQLLDRFEVEVEEGEVVVGEEEEEDEDHDGGEADLTANADLPKLAE